MGSSVRDGVLHVVRFEQSRDGDDETCTCSLAFGLDVLRMMDERTVKEISSEWSAFRQQAEKSDLHTE